MKVLKKATIVQKAKTTEHTRTERQVLEHIRQSPFLVTLHYAFQTDTKLHLILGEQSSGFKFLFKKKKKSPFISMFCKVFFMWSKVQCIWRLHEREQEVKYCSSSTVSVFVVFLFELQCTTLTWGVQWLSYMQQKMYMYVHQ